MPLSADRNKPRATWRVAWRGLMAAVAISLIAHCAVLEGSAGTFALKTEIPQATASLRTRIIDIGGAESQVPARTIAPQSQPSRTVPSPNSAAAPLDAPKTPRTDESSVQVPSASQESIALDAAKIIAPPDQSIADLSPATLPVAQSLGGRVESFSAATQIQLPGNMVLDYVATSAQRGRSRDAIGQLNWKTDGQNYELRIGSSLMGIAVLDWTSVGRIAEQGLSPARFADRRGLRSERAAHFRADIGKIQFSNNRPEAPLLLGAQDRISVLVQLSGFLRANAERLAKGDTIAIQVANTDLAEMWELRFEGVEEVLVPAGKMQAYKFARQARREFDQGLQVWLAAQVQFMPVRILQSSPISPEGDFFELSLGRLP